MELISCHHCSEVLMATANNLRRIRKFGLGNSQEHFTNCKEFPLNTSLRKNHCSWRFFITWVGLTRVINGVSEMSKRKIEKALCGYFLLGFYGLKSANSAVIIEERCQLFAYHLLVTGMTIAIACRQSYIKGANSVSPESGTILICSWESCSQLLLFVVWFFWSTEKPTKQTTTLLEAETNVSSFA